MMEQMAVCFLMLCLRSALSEISRPISQISSPIYVYVFEFADDGAAIGSQHPCHFSSPVAKMISSPGLRVPEPLTHLIPTSWRETHQPFESLDQVPNLSTIRFELDISLLVYQPLNYITVTLDWHQLDTKEYTVDDLKHVIYSRLGQERTKFWMALPSTGDSRVMEVPHTCTLEHLVLYYVNSRGIRLLGIGNEHPRESTSFPYRPLHTVASRLHDDAICQLRLPLTAHQTYRELRQFD